LAANHFGMPVCFKSSGNFAGAAEQFPKVRVPPKLEWLANITNPKTRRA
jgi:hypothetical protein